MLVILGWLGSTTNLLSSSMPYCLITNLIKPAGRPELWLPLYDKCVSRQGCKEDATTSWIKSLMFLSTEKFTSGVPAMENLCVKHGGNEDLYLISSRNIQKLHSPP